MRRLCSGSRRCNRSLPRKGSDSRVIAQPLAMNTRTDVKFTMSRLAYVIAYC